MVKELRGVIHKHVGILEDQIIEIRNSRCETVGNAEKGLEEIKHIEKDIEYLNKVMVFSPEDMMPFHTPPNGIIYNNDYVIRGYRRR